MFYKGNEDREKRLRFSIRKVSFGAASVAVATLFMFPGNGTVSATEQGVTPTNEETQGSPLKDPDVQNGTYGATPVVSQLDGNSGSSETTAPKDQEETTTPTSTDASASSVESPTVSKEKEETSTTATPAPVVSSTASATEKAEEKATSDLDKKQLEDYVAEIDVKLASGSYATKTDESVATLKEHLELAKLALTTATSQEELTKAYRKLLTTVNSGLRSKPKAQVESPKLDTTEGKATVGKKASNTEKATGSNSIANSGQHDPRNRQVLDRNNPFRTGETTTDTDPAANQTYTAPSADASLEELVKALKTLPTTITNETKLADIDQVAATKGIDPGTVKELDEFGGWKAVRDSEGRGKFAVARKTSDGVFPIETVNTVKLHEYTNRTWTLESVVDRGNEHVLLLSEVRTEKTKDQAVFDETKYREIGEPLTIARGLKGYNGIEKTFKAYSPTTGSTTKVSFKTGYTGDIDGHKAKYKVEVLGRTTKNSNFTSLYSVTFDPSVGKKDANMQVIAARDGNSQRFDTPRGSTTPDTLNKKLADRRYSPNGRTGTFTSKDIEIPVGYTEYTVRISSADNTHLGMGYQVPWKHYALPIAGLEFSITQDTKHIAKSLLQQAYDRLLKQQNSDENRKTPGTTRNYQEKLDEIKGLLDSGDLKSRTDYLTALEAAIEARDDLKTQAPSAPVPAVVDTADHVGVEIPAPEHADKVVVTFDKADGSGKDTVTVKKNDQGKWSADKTVTGLTVDADTGKVTVGHEAVKAQGTVEAQARSGNSDLSGTGTVGMPAIATTPSAPVPAVVDTADHVGVEIPAPEHADKVVVTFDKADGSGKDTVTVKKNDQGKWSADKTVAGLTVDADTGKVTVGHEAVKAEGTVEAQARSGNSDLSGTGTVGMPAIATTPSAPVPAVVDTADHVGVEIPAPEHADKVVVTFDKADGSGKDTVTVKKNDQGKWSADKTVAGLTVDADTGKVTVGHEAVKAQGTVEAQARSGNSDLSGTGTVGMPAIATTPSAPVPAVVDTADHVGIEIPAPEHADKVVVTFDKADGSGKDTVTVKKNDQGKWSADKTVAGLTVDADTGKVTVGHEAVKAEGTVEAQARSGNSDLSGTGTVGMPAIATTPSAPVPAVVDTADHVGVEIPAPEHADKVVVTFDKADGSGKDTVTVKKNDQGKWSADKTVAGLTVDADTGKVTVGHEAVKAQGTVEAQARSGNSDLSGTGTVGMPAIATTPSAPVPAVVDTADHVGVEIPAPEHADKVVVTFDKADGSGKDTVTVKKNDQGKWSADKTVAGLTVDADTGKVTVGHEAVKAQGTVEAQARSGNSDLSGTGTVGMPAIATTPSAPVPAVVDTADHVGVEIPAPEHADKVVVTFDKADGSGKDTVTVKKNDQGKWSADKTVTGLTVDADTGKVTVGHEAVKAEGTVEAQARSGNSDLSGTGTVGMPAIATTPSAPVPAVVDTADHVGVEIPAPEHADKVVVTFDKADGSGKDTVTVKKNDQGKWSADKTVAGLTVDADTGKVTVGHEAVKAQGTVEAQARSGNSDLSGTGTVGMPAIATTPSAPVPAVVDTADHVGVEIPAPEHADKVVVTFDKADGSGKDTVTVKKNDQGKWSADKTVAGLTVDADTGKVTVGHEAVKAEGTVEAQARSGNSDLSGTGTVGMPAIATTPSAPVPAVVDTADHVGVEIPAPEHADKVVVTFDKADGSGKDTVTVKKNDQGKWSADKTVTGLTVDADTGKVTVGHEAVKAEGTVEAQARSGNSDLSGTGSAQMPIYRPAPLPRPIPVPDNGNTNSLVPSDLDGNQAGNAGDVNTTEPASPSVPTSPSDSGQANSGQDGRSTDSGSTTTARSSVAPVTTTEPTVNTANREDDTVRSATQGQGTLDKSELSKQVQTLENLLRTLTGVSNPTTDSARLVLAEAKKALADDSLTEQGLRHILQTVKDAIASLESIKESQSATKAGEQKVSEEAPEADKSVAQTQISVGAIVVSILVLLGLLFFLLARRNKESELEKLTKELSKLLKNLNLETVDKDVLKKSQEELQNAVSFLADEKGSEHTEAELIDNLKEVLAKLKANA